MLECMTCIGPGCFELYGQRMIETFRKFWPKDIPLTVYYHDCDKPQGEWDNVTFVNLNEVSPDFITFKQRASKANGIGPQGQYNYRFDALKFSAKVFAMGHKANSQKAQDVLMWLDGDTYTHAEVTHEWLEKLLADGDLIYLPRTGINYSETAFMAFRGSAKFIIADMVDQYSDGEIFNYVEHHDGFVFERLLYLHKLHGLQTKGLTPAGYPGLEAFENSVLAEKMHHLKGNKKTEVQCGNRYDQLNELVKFYAKGKSSYTILETGTWDGRRAVELANAAFSVGVQEVTYYGYDLFEDATQETDTAEFNTKPHNTRDSVSENLRKYAETVSAQGRKFNYILTKGDTKKTLTSSHFADFAWLDGGHSYESAAHDYKVCRDVPVVVFDDFIKPDPTGRDQPEEHKGTNRVVSEIKNRKVKIYEAMDPVVSGGITNIALVIGLGEKVPPELPITKSPTAPGWKPMVVTPHDCVDESHLIKNVEENLKLITEWTSQCKSHSGALVIASGGPSIRENINKIKELVAGGAKVAAVKHALPYLREAGIKPWAIVVLDPRPIEGVSTHGIKRKDLFQDVPDGTICFVASMTDPEVTKYLLQRGLRVVGWHAYTKGLAEYKKWPAGTQLITGGTCSAWRIVGLGASFGFTEFHAFGMDFSYDKNTVDIKEKDDDGRPKYYVVSPDQGKTTYVSTGELIAAAQDTQQIFPMVQSHGYEFYMYGEGFGPHLWRLAFQGRDQTRKRFEELYG